MLLSSTLSILAVIIALLIQSLPPERNPKTACRTDKHLSTHTIVMVDRSEHWTAQQTQLLSNALRKVALDLPIDGRLSFGTFSGKVEPEQLFLFDRCNPGDHRSVSWLTARPDKQQETYEQAYLTPLSELIQSLSEPKETKHSYISHVLGSVAARFAYSQSTIRPKLLLFSDMREHTERFSFYRRQKPSRFAAYFAQALPTKHTSFSVEVYHVPTQVSSKATSDNVLQQAWQRALDAQGIPLTWRSL